MCDKCQRGKRDDEDGAEKEHGEGKRARYERRVEGVCRETKGIRDLTRVTTNDASLSRMRE